MANIKIYDNLGNLCNPCVQSIRYVKADGTLTRALAAGDKIISSDGSVITLVCDEIEEV